MLMFNGLWKQLGRRPVRISLTGVLLAAGFTAYGGEPTPASRNSALVSPALQSRVRELIDEVSEAAVELDVAIDRPKLIRGKKDVVRIIISNPQILKIEQIDGRDLEFIGKRPGSTAVTLWMGEPRQSQVLQLMVVVKAGPGGIAPAAFRPGEAPTDREEAAPIEDRGGAELEQAAQEQFPRSQIRLLSAADKVLVHGSAKDALEASRILRFIRGQVAEAASAAGAPDPEKLAEVRVVNLLKVRTKTQLRLRVQRVEIPRPALRQFCEQFSIRFEQQTTKGWEKPEKAPAVATLDASAFQGYLKVLQTRRTVKVVEEPNLLTSPGRLIALQTRTVANRSPSLGLVQPAAHKHAAGDESSTIAIVPTLAEKGRVRIEIVPPHVDGVRPVAATTSQTSSTYGTELRPGEALVITGLPSDSPRTETATLLIVTPEISSTNKTESAPSLVPATRGSKPTARRSAEHGPVEEVHQRSLDFYLSGPVGYSD